MPDVIVVGAGPVGLLLSGLLAAAGVDATVVERRPTAGAGSRAIGVHAPVLAALESSGLTDELLAEALRVGRGEARSAGRTLGVVRFDRLSTRFPFVATLPQHATEAVLTARVPAIVRGTRVTAVADGPREARVRTAERGVLAAPIVVVAAGGKARELVYRSVPTRVYRDRYLMADVLVAQAGSVDDAVAVVHLDRDGVLESFPLPGGRRRLVAWDRGGDGGAGGSRGDGGGRGDGGRANSADDGAAPDDTDAARAARLADAAARRGEGCAAASIVSATAFGVRRVVAPALRRGRVVVIGDAAHEVSPIGGQGMNLGLLDAATLAPLVVEWVRTGIAPEAALARWEDRRVRSARTAARLAAVNTALGRPLGPVGDAARRGALRLALGSPLGRAFAAAYAMGLDADS